jgi:hypothetical protein
LYFILLKVMLLVNRILGIDLLIYFEAVVVTSADVTSIKFDVYVAFCCQFLDQFFFIVFLLYLNISCTPVGTDGSGLSTE